MNKQTWAHLHLPRYEAWEDSRGDSNVISMKVPGKKPFYTSSAVLFDVTFKVHGSGRQRALREGVRNVHAWVVGTDHGIRLLPEQEAMATPEYMHGFGWRKAVYSPFKGSSFVDTETLEPVHTAKTAVMVGKDVYYRP